MLVTFIKRWRAYNRGETAGFDDAMASDLVSGGFAVPFVEQEAAADVAAPTAATEPTEPTAATEPTEPTEATEPTEPSEATAPKGKPGK